MLLLLLLEFEESGNGSYRLPIPEDKDVNDAWQLIPEVKYHEFKCIKSFNYAMIIFMIIVKIHIKFLKIYIPELRLVFDDE